MKKTLLMLLTALFLYIPTVSRGCDETLVMLLTAKNPNSEFSVQIRRVAIVLSQLGATLKAGLKEDYSKELQMVMDAWLGFATRYMNNPPDEAKTDRNWAEKTRQTAEEIGRIRKLILEGERLKAHDRVLELSSRIGTFFEAYGISPEKKLFLDASNNLTILEQKLLAKQPQPALSAIASLSINLADFIKIIPDTASSTATNLEIKIGNLEKAIQESPNLRLLDQQATELRSMFEELRSHILMKEWFPETQKPLQEDK